MNKSKLVKLSKNINLKQRALEIMATEQCSKCCSSGFGGNGQQKLK